MLVLLYVARWARWMKLETALLHSYNIIEYLHNRGGLTALPAVGESGLEIESDHFWTLDPTAPGWLRSNRIT
jgi:hypothetical protein